ncbi:hypothetical protein IFM89_001327 [Coptis chinensis]|uniref:Uncharacterized protein n=1 Tax=Coptis chinensis TaxID=261450 RepID=A0A835GWU0_9MAGN|nr:hypothetical protein IFM89_001327 [Coptis chinensis]
MGVLLISSRLWAFSGGLELSRENAHGAKFRLAGEHCLEVAGSMGTSRSVNLWENTCVNIQPHHSGIESREDLRSYELWNSDTASRSHVDTFVKEEI